MISIFEPKILLDSCIILISSFVYPSVLNLSICGIALNAICLVKFSFLISLDSIYTPVKNVKYEIENYRVEQKTDYEKLVFEITTDGSIDPKNALTEGAKVLIHHFMLFSDERITLEADEIAQTETYDEESLHMRQLLKTRLIDMDLSVRALNCLKAAEVDTLGDLVSFNKNDLIKIIGPPSTISDFNENLWFFS